jgi:hypothetical protein
MNASDKSCRRFVLAMAVLVVLLTLLLFFAWSHKKDNSPEPQLSSSAVCDYPLSMSSNEGRLSGGGAAVARVPSAVNIFT